MRRVTRFRQWVLVVVLTCAAGTFGLASAAAAAKYAAMVVDGDTGRVLHAVDADTQRYPASLTKMMTLYMAFEALDRGRITLATRIPMSTRAVRQPPSKLGLKVGASISVQDAILVLVTKSANDVAVALAEKLGGTEAEFARMMTRRARDLGMSRTTFRNASGLPDTGQLSTARDMATLALALLRHYPHHYRYFATRTFKYGGRSYPNHNRLLGSYPGLDGIKTGYIRASGYNLVASARRNGRRIVGVIFGGETSAARNAEMAGLLDHGFRTILARGGAPGGDVVGANLRTAPVATASGRSWGVQVGAFRAHAPATDTARDAARLLQSVMPGSGPQVQRSRRGNGTVYYLARVLYGRKAEAYEACRLLEARRFRCMVLRMKDAPDGSAALDGVVPLDPPPVKPLRTAAVLPTAQGSADPDEPSWAVQLGAFPARHSAERAAMLALGAAPQALAAGDVSVSVVPTGAPATRYRARVVGMTRTQAEEACRRLEGKDFPCLVLRL